MKKIIFYCFFIGILFCGCSSGTDDCKVVIPCENSSIKGEASTFASITNDSITLTLTKTENLWVFKVRLKLKTEKTAFFGDCKGSSFELRVLNEDGEPIDAKFLPGSSEQTGELAYQDLMDMLSQKKGTTRLFTFHYIAGDKESADKLMEKLKKSTGVQIINFDFYGNYGELESDEPLAKASNEEPVFDGEEVPYGEFAEASIRLLTDDDVRMYDKLNLKYMKNEIYARHGYIFTDAELKEHFEHEFWYEGKYTDVSSMLTDIERKNIKLIQKYENR